MPFDYGLYAPMVTPPVVLQERAMGSYSISPGSVGATVGAYFDDPADGYAAGSAIGGCFGEMRVVGGVNKQDDSASASG